MLTQCFVSQHFPNAVAACLDALEITTRASASIPGWRPFAVFYREMQGAETCSVCPATRNLNASSPTQSGLPPKRTSSLQTKKKKKHQILQYVVNVDTWIIKEQKSREETEPSERSSFPETKENFPPASKQKLAPH